MRIVLLILFLISRPFLSAGSNFDSRAGEEKHSVLIVPYMPAMHLSDADNDISEGSAMEMPDMRSALRMGIVKSLNKKFSETNDVRNFEKDFVGEDNRDMDVLYHTLLFEGDSVYPLKNPALYAVKDTLPKKKGAIKTEPETMYMNVGIHDDMLVPDLAKKYNSDYIIFLNEIDIKTHFEDCMNLALKIYRRDLKIHYSIFDKTGKQLYGDVAVSHFGSKTNDVNEIMKENYPAISDYILRSFDKVAK